MSIARFSAAAAFIGALVVGAGSLGTVIPQEPVTIVVVGDIMLSRNVAARMRSADDPLLPFRNVSAILDASDLNFGNLESPFAPNRGESGAAGEPGGGESAWDGVIGGRSLVFAAPNQSVRALSRYNFRVLALANNHAMDQGEAGLDHTLRQLSDNRIQAAGAGVDLGEAWQARIAEVKGVKVGFLAVSYASLNYGTSERNEHVARIEDIDRLRSRVRELKSQGIRVVVAMHAGDEYTSEPAAAQVVFARAAVDAGAEVVVGSHPHCLQPVERYKGGLIFYSLGNFVFDLDSSPATREGAAVKLFFGPGDGVAGEVFPVEIENACCPRPARPDEVHGALRRMRLPSTHIPFAGWMKTE